MLDHGLELLFPARDPVYRLLKPHSCPRHRRRPRRHGAGQLRGKLLHHIFDAFHQSGPLFQQTIPAPSLARKRAARDREHLPILLQGQAGSDKRSALLSRLYHHNAQAQTGDQTITDRKILRHRRAAQRQFAEEGAALFKHRVGQLAMLRRVDYINAAAQYRNRPPVSFQRAAMSLSVDPARQAADHGDAL
jgi:hypothetical protein